jgi:hypothetical protein
VLVLISEMALNVPQSEHDAMAEKEKKKTDQECMINDIPIADSLR